MYHGGKEHCRYPSPRLRNLCREMVLCGADVVIAQHSHCIGCYEEYEDGHIVYGQGNFHFCWSNMAETWYTSLLIELEIKKELKIKFIPLLTKEKSIDVAKGEDADEILHALPREVKNCKMVNGVMVGMRFASKCKIPIRVFYKGFVRLKRKRMRRNAFHITWIVKRTPTYGKNYFPRGI